jgi:PAS domain-containing protein
VGARGLPSPQQLQAGALEQLGDVPGRPAADRPADRAPCRAQTRGRGPAAKRRARPLAIRHDPPCGLCVRFRDLDFLEVNDAAVQQYGYSRDEFLRMKTTDIRPAEEAERFKRYLQQIPIRQRPPRDSGSMSARTAASSTWRSTSIFLTTMVTRLPVLPSPRT